jgi:integrase
MDSTKSTSTGKPTYYDLKIGYGKFLEDAGKQTQIKNLNTILRSWIETIGLTESSPIGSELNGDFDSQLDHYASMQEASGCKPSTYRPRVSHLRALKKFYESTFEADNLPSIFHSALSQLIINSGYESLADFHQQCVSDICRIQRLRYWCAGRFGPSKNSLPLVEEFERRLNVKTGTLTSLLSKRLRGSCKTRKVDQTSYGKKLMIALKKPYAYWSEYLESEWVDVVNFMTASYLPEGKKRNSVWTSSNSCKGITFPSAKIRKGFLKSFFGYCCLPESPDPSLSGLGMDQGKMTLALLTEKRLVEDYLEFQKTRAGGIYTRGTLSFIELVAHFLRVETGYLYQHPAFAKKLHKRLSPSEWARKCSDTRERLISIKTQLMQKGLIVKGRDPEAPIEQILAQDRPLYVLLQMIKDMQQDMPSANSSKRAQAIHYRDLLLIGLLSSNPLRVRQFTIMEFDRHLKRRDNGEWWLEFKKSEFKNRKVLESDYSVRVEGHLWPIIERYRNEFRPYLAGAKHCRYVFRQGIRRKDYELKIRPMSKEGLSCLLIHLTRLYIPITPGFYAHAFRHIVATDIIKRNPEFGFFVASKALHDNLETVERAYAHLKTHEYFEPVNRHFGEAWDEVIGKN